MLFLVEYFICSRIQVILLYFSDDKRDFLSSIPKSRNFNSQHSVEPQIRKLTDYQRK